MGTVSVKAKSARSRVCCETMSEARCTEDGRDMDLNAAEDFVQQVLDCAGVAEVECELGLIYTGVSCGVGQRRS